MGKICTQIILKKGVDFTHKMSKLVMGLEMDLLTVVSIMLVGLTLGRDALILSLVAIVVDCSMSMMTRRSERVRSKRIVDMVRKSHGEDPFIAVILDGDNWCSTHPEPVSRIGTVTPLTGARRCVAFVDVFRSQAKGAPLYARKRQTIPRFDEATRSESRTKRVYLFGNKLGRAFYWAMEPVFGERGANRLQPCLALAGASLGGRL